MRITKLHILLFFLLAGAGVYSAHYLKGKQSTNSKPSLIQRVKDMIFTSEVEESTYVQTPVSSADEPASDAGSDESDLVQSEPTSVVQSTPEPVQAPIVVTPEREDFSGPATYVVQRGDTLWSIAEMQEHFGEGKRWYDIWKANSEKIGDFDALASGMTLEIPLDKPEGYAWAKTTEAEKSRILSRSVPERN